MATEQEQIDVLQESLRKLTSDWQEDGCTPANFVRRDGMGKEIARVDRWCGDFQNSWYPIVIGWRAQIGCYSDQGVILVKHRKGRKPTLKSIKVAMEEAKSEADCMLKLLIKEHRD